MIDELKTKRIPLTQGKFALVDDADYTWLNRWKWFAMQMRGNFYAYRGGLSFLGTTMFISMHRQILGLEDGDSQQGDHLNHNTLDNRRDNIRICTISQNQMNRKVNSEGSSIYKGVTWHKRAKKWTSQIVVGRKLKYLGLFTSERTAAFAYNLAAKKHFKKFACLNQI